MFEMESKLMFIVGKFKYLIRYYVILKLIVLLGMIVILKMINLMEMIKYNLNYGLYLYR